MLCTVQDRKSDQTNGIEAYDIHTRTAIHNFRSAPGVWAHGLTFMPEQGAVFSVLRDKSLLQIHRWGKEHGAQKMVLPEKICTFQVSRTWCAGGTSNGKLYIWEVASGDLVAALEVHYQEITCIEFCMDEGVVITGGADGRIAVVILADCLTQANNYAAPFTPDILDEHKLGITALCCGIGSSRVARLFSASMDETVKVWDIGLRACLLTIRFSAPLTSLTVDSAERAVFAGSQEGIISQFELYGDGLSSSSLATTVSSEVLFKGHQHAVTCLGLTIESNLLISASDAGDINLWDVCTAQLLSTLRPPGGKVVACTLSIIPSTPNVLSRRDAKHDSQFQVLNKVVANRATGLHSVTIQLQDQGGDIAKKVDRLKQFRSALATFQ